MTVRSEMALAEASRALEEQRATIDTMHSRAGILLAAAAIGNVGLGPLAFGGHVGIPLPGLAWPGIVAAIVAYGLLLAVSLPMAVSIAGDADAILDRTDPFDVADSALAEAFARRAVEAWRANEDRLGRRRKMLSVALVALTINACSWALVAAFARG